MQADAFLKDLALVLCVAAITSVVFQRLRLPAAPGYIVAGLLIGPHVPFPLVANLETVQTLAELGVVLLMWTPLGPAPRRFFPSCDGFWTE